MCMDCNIHLGINFLISGIYNLRILLQINTIPGCIYCCISKIGYMANNWPGLFSSYMSLNVMGIIDKHIVHSDTIKSKVQ